MEQQNKFKVDVSKINKSVIVRRLNEEGKVVESWPMTFKAEKAADFDVIYSEDFSNICLVDKVEYMFHFIRVNNKDSRLTIGYPFKNTIEKYSFTSKPASESAILEILIKPEIGPMGSIQYIIK